MSPSSSAVVEEEKKEKTLEDLCHEKDRRMRETCLE